MLVLILVISTTIKAQSINDSITIELTKLSKKSGLVGFGVALVNKDSIVYAKGFGYANKETKTPYTTHTVQPVASVSKTVLAVALMKAQELGKLNINDPINDYLPFKIHNPNFPNKNITILQLANHTSGIIDGDNYEKTYLFDSNIQPQYENIKIEDRTEVQKLIELYNSNALIPLGEFIQKQYVEGEKWYSEKHFAKHPPGSKYKYSNMGANIAAYIIEQIFEEDYRVFVQKHILNPLNMNMSGWRSKNYQLKNESTLYWYGFPMPKSDLITYPDGNFMTNIVDFSKFMTTMIQGYNGENNILKHNSYLEMMKDPTSKELKKGVFWSIDSQKIGHSGNDPGIISHAYFLKNNGKGIIIFVNTSDTENGMLEVRTIYRTIIKYL